MRLQFINKNNNGVYDLAEPVVLTENYNEELDSCNVIIEHLTSELDIEPFDKVILIDEDGRFENKYFCVDSYQQTQIGLNPRTYKYEISLFSETKELEGVVLPNLTITPSIITESPSIWTYLQNFNNLYGRKIKVGTEASWEYVNKWYFADEVETLFANVECPEMQFNCPTLREVFTKLMMVKDCIPVVRNNEISYINLTATNNNISSYEQINYIYKSQSSADYVSEVQSNMVNVMQTNVDGINNVVTTREVLTFQADDDGWLVTSDNIVLKTTYPILNIKHLYMRTITEDYDQATETSAAYYYDSLDLCNVAYNNTNYSFVKEYDEYKTLNIKYTTGLNDITGGNASIYTTYQNYCIYFNRYSNTINGFSANSKRFLWYTRNLLEWYILSLSSVIFNPTTDYDDWYYSVYFVIEYETTADAIYRASKNINPANERVVIDNQDFSFVDAYSHGRLEQQKANRLGNKQMMVNAIYHESDFDETLIEIGDYYNENGAKNIVYKAQYQIFKNHINVNAYLTKDYVMRDYFTGIRSKIRTWENAKSEAQQRHDIQKLYCEFSYTKKIDSYDDFNVDTSGFPYYLCSPFYSTSIAPIKYVAVRTKYTDENNNTEYFPAKDADNYQWYVQDCISRVVGNSLVFTFGFTDNFYVDKHPCKYDNDGNKENIETSDISVVAVSGGWASLQSTVYENFGGIALAPYSYVNGQGNYSTINYRFLTALTGVNLSDIMYQTELTETLVKVLKLPLLNNEDIYSSTIKLSNEVGMYKDNKEIPYISTQLEFLTDTRDIIVTRKFVEYQEAIRTGTAPTLKYFVSLVGTLQDTLPSDVHSRTITISVNNTTEYYATITFTMGGVHKFYRSQAYYVCDNDNNVLLAFKPNYDESLSYSTTNVLYLNVLRQRNTNIYESQENQIIVGNIEEE